MVTRIVFGGLLIAASIGRCASAQITPQAVDQGKKATALVEILSGGKPIAYGSAFCMDESGIFVTNAHVADGTNDVSLIIDPGEKTQAVIPAKVLRADKQLDLAILQAKQPAAFVALTLGKTGALTETNDVIAMGYPFGGAMAMDPSSFPSISVNMGHITSLRRKNGELELIQVDAALNPGNSGGPVLDAGGSVIGIVEAGIVGSGVNFAIPVDRLMKLLKAPLLSVLPSTLDYAKRSDVQEVVVKVVSLTKPAPVYTVELTLKAASLPARVMTAQSQNGVCKFKTSLAPPAGRNAADLIVTASFADGSVSGHTLDRAIHVGGQKIMLAAVHELHFNPDGQAAVSTGQQTVTGALADLEGTSLTVGGASIRPNWTRVMSLTVASADEPVRSVQYTLKTSAANQTATELTGAFDFTGDVPAAPVAAAPVGLWALIRDGLTNHRTTESSSQGGVFSMKEPFSDIPNQGGVLIGFNYSMGTWVNRQCVSSLQPIYLIEHGQRLGTPQGQVNYPAKRVEAKSGYVVSGVRIRAGGNFDGFSVVFTRLSGTTLDPTDSYESDWVGATDGDQVKSIDTGGGLAVGISGKKADKIGSLALVVLPADPAGTVAPAAVAPAQADPAASASAQGGPPMPVGAGPPAADAPTQPPAPGQPYRSFQQMFETLSADLQPSNGTWAAARRVGPALTLHVRGQPALLGGEFAVTHPMGEQIEAELEVPGIHYHGIELTGQIHARFAASEAQALQSMAVHQQITVAGNIDHVVIRGAGTDTVVIWLTDCSIK